MCSAVEPEACHSLGPELRRQEKLLLPLQGVARGSETIEDNAFSSFLARPEQVRFGLRTRRLFPRPLQRTVRFELFGTLVAESLSPFFDKKNGGVKETNNDVFRPEPKRRFLHMCTDGKAETVARIELKPARAKIAAANCIKVQKLCMYVMI